MFEIYRHAQGSPLWYTPPHLSEWIRATIGEYFDPCPKYWDGEKSGLDIPWEPVAYINHPGSGGRTSQQWWTKMHEENARHDGAGKFVYCFFNVEQIRKIEPSPLKTKGWMIWPKRRTRFVWGGESGGGRVHGEPYGSPRYWSAFWTNVEPAEFPEPCEVTECGG